MDIYFNTKHRRIFLIVFLKNLCCSLLYQENVSNLDSPKPWILKLNFSATLKHFPYLHGLKHGSGLVSILGSIPLPTLKKSYFLHGGQSDPVNVTCQLLCIQERRTRKSQKMTQALALCLSNKERQGLKIKYTSCKVKNSCYAKSF